MLSDTDRIEAARRISAVRRWARNGDVLGLCDLLEKACATVSGNVTLNPGKGANVTLADLANVTPCPVCEKRRAGNAKRQARHKARVRKSTPEHAGIASP